GLGSWTRRCLRQADRLLILAAADSSPVKDIGRLLADEYSDIDRDLVLLHPHGALHPVGTQQWLDAYGTARHQHLRLGHEGDIQRLARSFVGRAVGLVLSGGGARCLAHIGVIRAIQESGIPIDWIGGSSAGAVIAGEYAMGW